MSHPLPKHKAGQSSHGSSEFGSAIPSRDHKIEDSTGASVFAAFTEPMLRNAGVFQPCHDAKSIYEFWTPIGPSDAPSLAKWVHRELLTFGFLLELAFSDFSYAKCVTQEFVPILEAFRKIMDGEAYLTIVDGKPAMAVFAGVQRTILATAPRTFDVLRGDPVDCLHGSLCSAAQVTRPHSQVEIDALLRWADEKFVICAIESMKPAAYTPGQTRWPSKAQRDAGELISVVLGRRGVEWSADRPVLTFLSEPCARSIGGEIRGAARRPKARKIRKKRLLA